MRQDVKRMSWGEADWEIVNRKKMRLFGGPKTREIMCTPFVKRKKNYSCYNGKESVVVSPK